MPFEQTFCPSPWFHARIKNNGDFEFCRWTNKDTARNPYNIKDVDPVAWFQRSIGPIRQSILSGSKLPQCQNCYVMEQHGKVSGRQRQLLKIGADTQNFARSMLSTPWLETFQHSHENQGHTDQLPQDWQIDLGNYCNSACVFCGPHSSSRLASEFHRLGLIDELPPTSWCDDPASLDKFIQLLVASPRLVYLHFIGGETMITPAFKKILVALISNNLHQHTSIGFTTNLTVWNPDIIALLQQFREVHIGLSIECFHPLNDYVRYGGSLATTQEIIGKFITEAKKSDWYLTVRVTPTIFSIWHLDTVFEFVLANQLAIESCNFLDEPKFMRPSVLPPHYRAQAISKLSALIKNTDEIMLPVINSRSPQHYKTHALQDCRSYIDYLQHQPDESHRLPDLVRFLKLLESSRNNNILDYLPEYEELLRSAGY